MTTSLARVSARVPCPQILLWLEVLIYIKAARHVELHLFYFHPPTLLTLLYLFQCFIALSLRSIEHGHFSPSFPLV